MMFVISNVASGPGLITAAEVHVLAVGWSKSTLVAQACCGSHGGRWPAANGAMQ